MGFILTFKLKFHNICCPKNVFPLVINFMLGITVNAMGLIGHIRRVISYNSEPSNYSSRGMSCSNDYEPHTTILDRVTQWSQPMGIGPLGNYCSDILGSLKLFI